MPIRVPGPTRFVTIPEEDVAEYQQKIEALTKLAEHAINFAPDPDVRISLRKQLREIKER